MTTRPSCKIDLTAVNSELRDANAQTAVEWARDTFGEGLMMTTSFGVQAAVMLHLVSRTIPDIPVIFIDTGFHFPETYRFADELTRRLKLNLKVYQADLSPAWMVARHGQLWDKGVEGLNQYDQLRKVEPLQRALGELDAVAWFAGLRREQTDERKLLQRVVVQDGVHKIHPILTWSQKDVHAYLKKHDLPYHPLHEKGYASIGDWHSTLPVGENQHEREGRFRGLKQECGIHIPQTQEESASRDASML